MRNYSGRWHPEQPVRSDLCPFAKRSPYRGYFRYAFFSAPDSDRWAGYDPGEKFNRDRLKIFQKKIRFSKFLKIEQGCFPAAHLSFFSSFLSFFLAESLPAAACFEIAFFLLKNITVSAFVVDYPGF